jgi:hypothetical protein
MNSLEALPRYVLFAILLAGMLGVSPTPAKAACEGDALRFCGSAIPDRDRVKACLLQNFKQLSPDCQSQFREGRSANHRRRHHG